MTAVPAANTADPSKTERTNLLGLPEAKISITPNVADDAQQFSAFLKALGL